MRVLWGLALVLLLTPAVTAQDGKKKKRSEDAPPEIDPYTRFDAATIAAAGYVKVGGPIRLTRQLRSIDVQELLGKEWMVWAETPHFVVGSALAERYPPRGDRDLVERYRGELERLRDRGLDLPRRVDEVDPWLTLHLFAQRLEEQYAGFESWMGVTTDDFPAPPAERSWAPVDRQALGPYLGAHGKFVVVLFDEKADVERLAGHLGATAGHGSLRTTVLAEDVHVYAASREPYSVSMNEDSWFQCAIAGNVVRMFINAYRGYRYQLPLWWSEGLAHYTTRRLDPTYFSPLVAEGQDADQRRDPEWEDKVYARVQNDYYPTSAALMVKVDPREFEYADHLMAWSRVDFLFQREGAQPGRYLQRMKSLPWTADLGSDDVCAIQEDALRDGFGLDYASLDEEWVKWVRKAYHPKRRKGRR